MNIYADRPSQLVPLQIANSTNNLQWQQAAYNAAAANAQREADARAKEWQAMMMSAERDDKLNRDAYNYDWSANQSALERAQRQKDIEIQYGYTNRKLADEQAMRRYGLADQLARLAKLPASPKEIMAQYGVDANQAKALDAVNGAAWLDKFGRALDHGLANGPVSPTLIDFYAPKGSSWRAEAERMQGEIVNPIVTARKQEADKAAKVDNAKAYKEKADALSQEAPAGAYVNPGGRWNPENWSYENPLPYVFGSDIKNNDGDFLGAIHKGVSSIGRAAWLPNWIPINTQAGRIDNPPPLQDSAAYKRRQAMLQAVKAQQANRTSNIQQDAETGSNVPVTAPAFTPTAAPDSSGILRTSITAETQPEAESKLRNAGFTTGRYWITFQGKPMVANMGSSSDNLGSPSLRIAAPMFAPASAYDGHTPTPASPY